MDTVIEGPARAAGVSATVFEAPDLDDRESDWVVDIATGRIVRRPAPEGRVEARASGRRS